MNNYFTEEYKRYFEILNDNKSIVKLSNNLSIEISTNLDFIQNTYFAKIVDNQWNELGKPTMCNIILSNINNNIKKVSDFINNNLVVACDLAINNLLPTIVKIKEKQEKLNNKNNDLKNKNNELNKFENKPKEKDKIIVWENDYNLLLNQINNLKNDIASLIIELENLCQKAENIKSIISTLNSDINDLNISSMISNLNMKDSSPITLNKLLSDYENGLFPFKINEKSWIEDDNSIRFSFSYYTNTGIRERGIILLPKEITTESTYQNIVAYFSGSNGVSMSGRDDINYTFGKVNQPIIAFHREIIDGVEYRNDNQLEATNSAIIDFSRYFGTENSKLHALGLSRGAQDLYNNISKNPNLFTTATIMNGSIKFDGLGQYFTNEPEKIASLANSNTQINVFISSNDKNIPPTEQLIDVLNLDVNVNLYHVPLGEHNGIYNILQFDDISKDFSNAKNFDRDLMKLIREYNSNSHQQFSDRKNIDIYIIGNGASHSGPQRTCFSDTRFYDLIFNK